MTDTAEDTENTTDLVQMEEEKRVIRTIPFVTTLSRVVKDKVEGVRRVTLTCFACRDYDICGKKQEESVHISGERPTLFACLQKLRKRLEDHHVGAVPAGQTSRKTSKDRAKSSQDQVKTSNKFALET